MARHSAHSPDRGDRWRAARKTSLRKSSHTSLLMHMGVVQNPFAFPAVTTVEPGILLSSTVSQNRIRQDESTLW